MKLRVRTIWTLGVLMWTLQADADSSTPARTQRWSDTFVTRLEALALLEGLNSELLTHNSATLTLERWCGVHQLASPPRIVAERVPGVEKMVSSEQRRELGVGPTELVRYRRVKLLCGNMVLSEADNWYVPSRLTSDMNRLLETTDTPFGKAVQALHFQRHTLSAKVLWLPLPEGWEMNPDTAKADANSAVMPATLLEHRAVLTLPDGTPFSEVVESYSSNVLAFPVP